jgi:Tol biopolymer transport system component
VTRLPGTEGGSQPFFSPDGRWIGFCAWKGSGRYRLRKIPAEGGLAVDLADLPWLPAGARWEGDGRILLGSPGRGIHSVPAEGGPARELTTVESARETGHRLPSLLPDGRTLLMTTLPHEYGTQARVEAVSPTGGERKVLLEDAADARYLPSGHLVFARRGTLMAARFHPERLEVEGPPVPVVEGISQALVPGEGVHGNSGAGQFAVSEAGILVYAPGGIGSDIPIELLLVDETSRAEPLPGFDKPLVSPQMRYSPDGHQLAFVEQATSGLLWLFDVDRHTYRRLSDRGVAASPRWSPDGTRLVVAWSEAGPFKLWTLPVSSRGDWTQLTDGEDHDWAPSWSPDGQFVAFVRGRAPNLDVYLYKFEDHEVVPFLASTAAESHPEFSPDGRWLAYRSDESGRIETYITSFPDRAETLTVSREGGFPPAWSRDGRRLYYHSLWSTDRARRMMSVTIRQEPNLSLGPPTLVCWLPERFAILWPMRDFELHPDGRRFLVGRRIETEPEPPITRLTLVHNWFAELERLAPAK